jgi:hypothetical protein
MEKVKAKKPDFDRLSKPVQVLLKPHEYRNLDRIRRESPFPTIAAYVRALILHNIKDKKQTELL